MTFYNKPPENPVAEKQAEPITSPVFDVRASVWLPLLLAGVSGGLVMLTLFVFWLLQFLTDLWMVVIGILVVDIIWGYFVFLNWKMIIKWIELFLNVDINKDGVKGPTRQDFVIPMSKTQTRIGTIYVSPDTLNTLGKAVVSWRYDQRPRNPRETAFAQKKWVGRRKLFKDVAEYNQLINALVDAVYIAPVSDLTNERGFKETGDPGKRFWDYVSSDQYLADAKSNSEVLKKY